MNASPPLPRPDPVPDEAADIAFMREALALGRRTLGDAWPNPAVGAIVVAADGTVAGRGWTAVGGRPHAETVALRRAGDLARGGTLYVTLEPCSHYGRTPPCADAIIEAEVARVVCSLEDPDPRVTGRGFRRLQAAGVAVTLGVEAEAARLAHAGHFRRVRDGRPHIMLKLAVSVDGKAGLEGRKPAAITGPQALARAHLMRAEADAIMVGIGTVIADDPLLSCRLPGMSWRSPVRVVLDTTLRLPVTARIVDTARTVPVWVFAGPFAPAERERELRDAGVEVFRVNTTLTGRLDQLEVAKLLGTLGVTRVLVEGGPIIATDLVKRNLVDEAFLFTAPLTLGPQAIDALAESPIDALTHSPRLKLIDQETVGPDRLDHYVRV